jgi:hypothetical protein
MPLPKEHDMADAANSQSDLDILTRLNADYLAADQNGDVQRYEEILAEDFEASLPDFLLRDKKQFLEMMAAPRPFTELTADDVQIRLLGLPFKGRPGRRPRQRGGRSGRGRARRGGAG